MAGLAIITTIVMVLTAIMLESLVFWGVGILVVKVFGVAYVWTFWHGLVCAILYAIVKSLFVKNDN